MNKATVVLLLLVLVSAFSVVTVRHQNRLAFIELQQQEEIRDELQAEWGRLMLEKATWAMEQNIVEDAGSRLGMFPPSPDKIVTVQLEN